MRKTKIASLLMLSFMSLAGSAQVNTENSVGAIAGSEISTNLNSETREIFKRKGNLYASWGYHNAFFSKSDIHFKGEGYDFTISKVTARDEPGGHDFLTYVKPNMFTIPQFNWRIGYFINNKTFINFGHDHMKYSMDRQVTLLTGVITGDVNPGVYNNTEVIVGDDGSSGVYQSSLLDSLPSGFVTEFEHCDGLNDFSFEIGQVAQFWIAKSGKHALSAQGTFNVGMLIPDSDVDILEHEPMHERKLWRKGYHLAGYSLSASIGLQFDFFRHFFILGKLKAGYINMPDINTTIDGGKASQHFNFLEPMMLIGYSHSISRH